MFYFHLTVSLPSISTHKFPFCQAEDYQCGKKIMISVWADVIQKEKCPHACTTFQYTGSVIKEQFYEQDALEGVFLLKLYYSFDSPVSVTVHEEYLIYDMISLIGSVGGTLGIGIGFSVTGFVSFLLNMILRIIEN